MHSSRIQVEGVFAQRAVCQGCLPGGVFSQGGVCLEEVCLPRGDVWQTPPLNRITDACENITLSQLRCGR